MNHLLKMAFNRSMITTKRNLQGSVLHFIQKRASVILVRAKLQRKAKTHTWESFANPATLAL